MASIKDVAKKAGVSISTVSYVISGKRKVSEKTRENVLYVMDELGYRSHAVAKALASKRTNIIALVLSPHKRPIGITEMDFISAASERAIARGYHLTLWTVGNDSLKDLQELTAQGLFDGIILMEINDIDARVKWLDKANIPFEIVGRCQDIEKYYYTDIDFQTTILDALNYLKNLGHDNIAFINQSKEVLENGYGPVVKVHKYFNELCNEMNIHGEEFFANASPSSGYEIMEHIINDLKDVSAVMVMNDSTIPGIFRAAYKEMIKIPQDISLMSLVTSSRFAEMMVPAVTEMAVPSKNIMYDAVNSLIDRLEGEEQTRHGSLWPCELNIRKSTAEKRKK
ncbi:MAG: LacI family DNA-binding transcriptional regulator [Spirochaetales bacterium]|nr:LacI family DNA-binding transcriptional regulator [Spirochaetales bacterium]